MIFPSGDSTKLWILYSSSKWQIESDGLWNIVNNSNVPLCCTQWLYYTIMPWAIWGFLLSFPGMFGRCQKSRLHLAIQEHLSDWLSRKNFCLDTWRSFFQTKIYSGKFYIWFVYSGNIFYNWVCNSSLKLMDNRRLSLFLI